MDAQEAYYQARIASPSPSPGPSRVLSVVIDDQRARVQVAHAPPDLPGHPRQSVDGWVFYRQSDWDWRHASTGEHAPALATPAPGTDRDP